MAEPLGATVSEDRVSYRVWAPGRRRAEVVLYGPDGVTEALAVPMRAASAGGVFTADVEPSAPRLYKVRLDGEGPFPDPYSRSQPFGVHGPSEAYQTRHAWRDAAFRGVDLDRLVIQEVHVGAATPEGTFEGLIPRLAFYRDLGITAIELMPVAAFPGRWNWGYDGVSPFAPVEIYGGPRGLEELVDAAHSIGLAVLLDVVYNHLGPDGNYLGCYAPAYFTRRHATPWGAALDLDGPSAERARALILDNVAHWIGDFHLDGLRLDATDSILDTSSPHILAEIAARARMAGVATGRRVVVFAEDDRNEARLLRPTADGGEGLDGVWAGDFHHAVRRAVAGDDDGYFADFTGSMEEIAEILRRGWLFEGQFSGRVGGPRGTPAASVSPASIVHFIQNHDQIGNRAVGDRLGVTVGPEVFRALTALLLASPYTPLLFMGQEHDSATPFQYFTDHHAELGRRVTEGRRRELSAFRSFAGGDVADPQDPETFERSRLDEGERSRGHHPGVLELHRVLLALRSSHPALLDRSRGSFTATALGPRQLRLDRHGGGLRLSLFLNLGGSVRFALEAGMTHRVVLATEERRFGGGLDGPGAALVQAGVLALAGAGAVLLEAQGPLP